MWLTQELGGAKQELQNNSKCSQIIRNVVENLCLLHIYIYTIWPGETAQQLKVLTEQDEELGSNLYNPCKNQGVFTCMPGDPVL